MASTSSKIKLKNNVSHRVLAQLYHKNSKLGIQSAGWIIDSGHTSSDLTVEFDDESGLDQWFIMLHVVAGDDKVTYVSGQNSSSTPATPGWKHADLTAGDSGKEHTFTVDTELLTIVLASGSSTVMMRKLRNFQPIQQVFVLMLENRSFDSFLAFAGLNAVKASTSNYNVVEGKSYYVRKSAPVRMSKGPGHEFRDVLLQLCGPEAKDPKGGDYPPILSVNQTSYAASYADWGASKNGINLSMPMVPWSSPSIAYNWSADTSYLNVAFVALEEGTSKEGILHLSNWGRDGVYPAFPMVEEDTSPSISPFATFGSQWVGAYVAASTRHLQILETAANADPNITDSGRVVRSGTSPSVFGWRGNDVWIIAYQGDAGSLWLYENYGGGPPSDTGLSMMEGTSPSVAGGSKVGVWTAAFQSEKGTLCLRTSGGRDEDTGLPMKSASSPSVAFAPDGTWAVAFQERQASGAGTLSVYQSNGKIVRLKREIEAESSPSILAMGDGAWLVAFQSIGRGLVVVDQAGAVALNGGNMRSGTSPCIIGTDASKGTWEVAYQSMDGYACVLDQDGASSAAAQIGEIMQCFDTEEQLPVLHKLAQEFRVCDHWFSSLPGPTWPNRFFLHCATSGGLDDSPSDHKVVLSEVGPRPYSMASVFDKIPKQVWPGGKSHHLSYRVYQDCGWPVGKIEKTIGGPTAVGAAKGALSGAAAGGLPGAVVGLATGAAAGAGVGGASANPYCYSLYSDVKEESLGVRGLGWIPQVLSLEGVKTKDVHSMQSYASDLSAPYDPAYTFIEPHWGNARGDFRGGSSQHPTDGVQGGEGLIKAVYEGLRNSPLWYTSVLIITYDEHGGFFDSMAPDSATPPGDHYKQKNSHGFLFDRYGVRVPAIVISPLTSEGVSTQIFDHSSVPKTLTKVFGIPSLTARDQKANGVDSLCTKSIAGGSVRTDCPTSLPDPVSDPPRPEAPEVSAEALEASSQEPLPTSGNLIGLLQILLKVALELSDGSAEAEAEIRRDFQALKTRGDASRFAEEVWWRWVEAQGLVQS